MLTKPRIAPAVIDDRGLVRALFAEQRDDLIAGQCRRHADERPQQRLDRRLVVPAATYCCTRSFTRRTPTM